MYKGKCATLQRDSDLTQNYMNKVNNDSSSQQEQFAYMKERVRNLEHELEKTMREKTDFSMENKSLQLANNQLEKDMQDMKIEKIRAQGETTSSGATVQRLQTQLNNKITEAESLLLQKEEFEKLIKELKRENLEAEKKAADYY